MYPPMKQALETLEACGSVYLDDPEGGYLEVTKVGDGRYTVEYWDGRDDDPDYDRVYPGTTLTAVILALDSHFKRIEAFQHHDQEGEQPCTKKQQKP